MGDWRGPVSHGQGAKVRLYHLQQSHVLPYTNNTCGWNEEQGTIIECPSQLSTGLDNCQIRHPEKPVVAGFLATAYLPQQLRWLLGYSSIWVSSLPLCRSRRAGGQRARRPRGKPPSTRSEAAPEVEEKPECGRRYWRGRGRGRGRGDQRGGRGGVVKGGNIMELCLLMTIFTASPIERAAGRNPPTSPVGISIVVPIDYQCDRWWAAAGLPWSPQPLNMALFQIACCGAHLHYC